MQSFGQTVWLLLLLAVCGYAIWQLLRAGGGERPSSLNMEAFHACDLPELSVRRLERDDFALCHRLFDDLQSAGLSPPGHDDSFSEWLTDPKVAKWMICSQGRPVACCGLSHDGPGVCSLSFGLMELEERGRGLGSLSLALRLWMVIADGPAVVTMWATHHSSTFYSRFGFVELPQDHLPEADRDEDLHYLGIILEPGDVHVLRHYLTAQLGSSPEEIS